MTGPAVTKPEQTPDPARCPHGAVLLLKGKRFACDQMRNVELDATHHDGWPHANAEVGAMWGDTRKPRVMRQDGSYPRGVPLEPGALR